MADYSELKAAIRAAIYDNVTQAITGDKLQEILLEMVDELGQSYVKPADGIPASDFTQALQDALAEIPEIFFATYGTTTFAQVTAARAAGKVCVVPYDGGIFVLGRSVGESTGNPITEYFFTSVEANASKRVSLKNTDAWSYAVFYLELSQNKVNTITGNEESTTKYPSAKAVWDAMEAGKEIFWATYGTTTASEIGTALSGNKLVACLYDSVVYVLTNYKSTETRYFFSALSSSNRHVYITCNKSDSTWSATGVSFEIQGNKVTALSASSTDTQYPSAKCVYNALATKQNVISSSNKLDYSLLANVPQDATPVSQSDQQFTFRQTAGGAKPGASLAKVTEVRGNTLVWNQLMNGATNHSDSVNGITITANANGSISLSGIATAGIDQWINYIDTIKDHYYLIKLNDTEKSGVKLIIGSTSFSPYVQQTTKGIYKCIGTVSNQPVRLSIASDTDLSSGLTVWPSVIDLTQMFGSGNEPATVAEFEALYREKYYAYNAGTLLNNKVASLETVGFNLVNIADMPTQTTLGTVDAEGVWYVDTPLPKTAWVNSFGYTGQIYLRHDVKYSSAKGNGLRFKILYTDGSVDTIYPGSGSDYHTATAISNANKVVAEIRTDYGSYSIGTWIKNLCINLSDPAKNGTYQPYEKHTLTLNLPTLTGKLNGEGSSVTIAADGLKSAGSAYDYGVVENGFLTKIVKAVDTRAYASGDESLATVTTDGSTYTNYALATPLTYVLDTPIAMSYFVNDLGTESITPTGVDANGVPNTAPLRASLQYGLTEGEMYGNLQAQSLPLAAFQSFLTALGTQMNGTWTWTESGGQYTFTFTPD